MAGGTEAGENLFVAEGGIYLGEGVEVAGGEEIERVQHAREGSAATTASR